VAQKSMARDASTRDADALRARLLAALGWEGVDPTASLFALGLVSVQAALVVSTVREALGVTVDEDLLSRFPSVDELARHVATLSACNASQPAPAAPPVPEWRGDVVLGEEISLGPFRIRWARASDAAALAALDAEAWPAPLRGLSETEISARIDRYAPGQLAIFEGRDLLVGSLYTQRIAFREFGCEGTRISRLCSILALKPPGPCVSGATFRDALALHTDDGPVWQVRRVRHQKP
jgi:acyl carrier protein